MMRCQLNEHTLIAFESSHVELSRQVDSLSREVETMRARLFSHDSNALLSTISPNDVLEHRDGENVTTAESLARVLEENGYGNVMSADDQTGEVPTAPTVAEGSFPNSSPEKSSSSPAVHALHTDNADNGGDLVTMSPKLKLDRDAALRLVTSLFASQEKIDKEVLAREHLLFKLQAEIADGIR